MSLPQLPAPIPQPNSELWAVLPFLWGAVTAIGGWFAAQYTAAAKLQGTLLNASRLLVEQSQAQHARDSARILELESENRRKQVLLEQQLGEIRQLQQLVDSFRKLP